MSSRDILVIEDDPRVQDLVLRTLRDGGYRSIVAVTRKEAFDALGENDCAAVILDLGLPGDDGISILLELRGKSAIPVLILTGRAGIHERVKGLEAGADDYLSKPFAPEELLARLRAVLRRVPKTAVIERAVEKALRVGNSRIDLRTREGSGPGTTERFTERELAILRVLASAKGPVARPALFYAVHHTEWNPENRSLDVHISHLRAKLEALTGEAGAIANIRGAGYELRLAVVGETDEAAGTPRNSS